MNDDAAIYLQNSEIAEKHSLEMQNCNKHEVNEEVPNVTPLDKTF